MSQLIKLKDFMQSSFRKAPYARVSSTSSSHATPRASLGWLPYSLRWPFLLVFGVYGCALIAAIALLYWKSNHDYGLLDDDGSSKLVFASRFVPTLLAVAFVFVATAIVDDVKRTEPFALLAAPNGALASNTLFEKPGQWWVCLWRSFPSRKREHAMRWTIFCAVLLYALGILSLSPFSSSLLVSRNVIIPTPATFRRYDTAALESPLAIRNTQTGFFRTVAHALQNVSTSAWITDKYFVVPFWPASFDSAPLGPILSSSPQSWTSITTVVTTELDCQKISLERTAWEVNITNGYAPINSSMFLGSAPGCTFGVYFPNYWPDQDWAVSGSAFAINGGASWATPSSFALGSSTVNDAPSIYSGSLINSSSCSDELLFISTTLINYDASADPSYTANHAVDAVAYSCKHSYYSADVQVTADASIYDSAVTFDESAFNKSRKLVNPQLVDVSHFQDLFLTKNWSYHLGSVQRSRPVAGGPTALLAALYNFSMDAMIKDSTLPEKAQALKQRYLGETVVDAITNAPVTDGQAGTVSEVRKRVVVVSIGALTLVITLGLQLLLLIIVYLTSRLSRRPLGLVRDPASALAVAALITEDHETETTFRGLGDVPKEDLGAHVGKLRYQLHRGSLHLVQIGKLNRELVEHGAVARELSGWRPAALKLPALVSLTLVLVVTLAAAAALYLYSKGSALYQTFFVYQASVTIGSDHLGDFGPIPVITTFLAVMIGLWWGSLETNLRILQPFVLMSKGPTNLAEGVAMSYRSVYSIWAACKASVPGYWLLVALCFATFAAQVLTISMSALWQRDYGVQNTTASLARQLETRRIPFITTGELEPTVHGQAYEGTVLKDLYTDLPVNWLYGAAIQLSLNGSEPAWSSNGWSFAPLDLTGVQTGTVQNFGNSPTQFNNPANAATNVTLSTQAVRARLECSSYEALQNNSNWFLAQDLTNSSNWNVTNNPQGLDVGYELGSGISNAAYDFGAGTITIVANVTVDGDGYYTSFFVNPSQMVCCVNDTTSTPGQASMGYWSANLGYGQIDLWSFKNVWPYNFTIKWIRGSQVQQYYRNNSGGDNTPHLIFTEEPKMTALNCQPFIEKANASVMVDHETGRIQAFNITDLPIEDNHAWSDVFKVWTNANDSADDDLSINVTTSYGVIFLDGLLSAADLSNVGGPDAVTGYSESIENLKDLTFNIRSPGLNVDYMTYSMLAMADNDHEALLDATVLEMLANKTFSTFFQHYASTEVTMSGGGRTFQVINETLPADIGKLYPDPYPKRDNQDSEATSNPKIAEVHSSRSVVVLRTSQTAALLTIIILSWLIMTAVITAIATPKATDSLKRKIETTGDIAVLVAGSDKLLKLVKSQRFAALADRKDIKASLGHFITLNGLKRYGIELTSEVEANLGRQQNSAYQEVPNAEPLPTPRQPEWQMPEDGVIHGSYTVASQYSHQHHRNMNTFPVRFPSLHRGYNGEDGDIALLPISRAGDQSQRPSSETSRFRYRDAVDSMETSTGQLAAVEYMRKTEPSYG